MTAVGVTSRWIAAARALETESATPIFRDPLARTLAGDEGFSMLAATRQSAGTGLAPDPYLSIRTRYLDDALHAAVVDDAIRQVVILAAGMDTRAFRLDWPAGTTVFEVDRDEIFAYKEPLLAAAGASPRCDRRIVRADLTGEWLPRLTAAGFDRERPAAFLIEGLLMYLEEDAVQRLLATVDSIAAGASWLGFDLVNRDMLTSPYAAAYMAKLRDLGCPWHYGCEDPEKMLASHGWNAIAVSPGDPEANYGRWPFPPVPRSLPGIPRSFYVTATRLTAKEREQRALTTATFVRSAPCLLVADVTAASNYYRDVLGFALDYASPDAREFAIVARGASTILLQRAADPALVRPNAQQGGTFDLFVWVDDVDGLYRELESRGATIVSPPPGQPHGVKLFSVRDLNGYVLSMGQGWSARQ